MHTSKLTIACCLEKPCAHQFLGRKKHVPISRNEDLRNESPPKRLPATYGSAKTQHEVQRINYPSRCKIYVHRASILLKQAEAALQLTGHVFSSGNPLKTADPVCKWERKEKTCEAKKNSRVVVKEVHAWLTGYRVRIASSRTRIFSFKVRAAKSGSSRPLTRSSTSLVNAVQALTCLMNSTSTAAVSSSSPCDQVLYF